MMGFYGYGLRGTCLRHSGCRQEALELQRRQRHGKLSERAMLRRVGVQKVLVFQGSRRERQAEDGRTAALTGRPVRLAPVVAVRGCRPGLDCAPAQPTTPSCARTARAEACGSD